MIARVASTASFPESKVGPAGFQGQFLIGHGSRIKLVQELPKDFC